MEDLYHRDVAMNGLYFHKKIGYEHIHLTSFSKMKVSLAAQVNIIYSRTHVTVEALVWNYDLSQAFSCDRFDSNMHPTVNYLDTVAFRRDITK